MKKMRKRIRGLLILSIALAIVGVVMLKNIIPVYADENIDATSYTNGVYTVDPADNVFGNILIPSGCIFEITSPITVTGTITIEKGGRLFIFSHWADEQVPGDNDTEGNISFQGEGNHWNITTGALIQIGCTLDCEHILDIPAGIEIRGDYNEETNQWTTFDNINDAQWTTFEYDSVLTFFRPLSVGDASIKNDSNNYIYAYSGTSVPTDAIVKELYARFFRVGMYGSFGVSFDENTGLQQLAQRVSADFGNRSGYITTVDGTEIDYYDVTVEWGYDVNSNGSPDENPVSSTVRVYWDNDLTNDSLLINTNYSPNTTSNWYLKDISEDMVPFSADGNNGVSNGILITENNFTGQNNVVIGGNGCVSVFLNDEGLFETELSMRGEYTVLDNNSQQAYNGTIVRVLKNGGDYVYISGSEDNTVDNLGVNNAVMDNIWEANNYSTAYVYIGSQTVYIRSVTVAGAPQITNVALADASQATGVQIDTTGLNDANAPYVSLTFSSNFYDLIPLTITFSNNDVKTITVQRIGLVFGYEYLPDDQTVGNIHTNCNGGNFAFNYTYMDGGAHYQQIVVYAIYYHPADNNTTLSGSDNLYLSLHYGDGNSYMINQYGHQDGGVETTVFILGFLKAHYDDGADIRTQDFVDINGYTGGVYGTVVNSGFDSPDTFGGTQIGSGQGVYWDGIVSWYSNN